MDIAQVQYDTLSLTELAGKLQLNYCVPLSESMDRADLRLQELKRVGYQDTPSALIEACTELLQCIAVYLHEEREHLIPYLKELQEKDNSGHNCGSCAGNCNVRHSSYLIRLHRSHMRMTKLLDDLQAKWLSPSDLNHPKPYRNLQNEILFIEQMLRRLIQTEQTEMIPRIIQSQKKINVRDH
jgi:hypothetical protein